MRWFKRHLNWTYLIGFLLGGSLFGSGSNYAAYGIDRTIGLIELWVGVIILWVINIWVLRRKGRSLLTILWGLLGILPIVVLCMKNKRQEHSEAGSNQSSE